MNKIIRPPFRDVGALIFIMFVYENGRTVDYDDSFNEVGPWQGAGWEQGYGDFNPILSLTLQNPGASRAAVVYRKGKAAETSSDPLLTLKTDPREKIVVAPEGPI